MTTIWDDIGVDPVSEPWTTMYTYFKRFAGIQLVGLGPLFLAPISVVGCAYFSDSLNDRLLISVRLPCLEGARLVGAETGCVGGCRHSESEAAVRAQGHFVQELNNPSVMPSTLESVASIGGSHGGSF
jgi:hypothetical protein